MKNKITIVGINFWPEDTAIGLYTYQLANFYKEQGLEVNVITGFKFTASNSVKDLTYIQDLLKDFPEAEKVAEVNKNYFQRAVDDGFGENFISELINKN